MRTSDAALIDTGWRLGRKATSLASASVNTTGRLITGAFFAQAISSPAGRPLR